MNDDAALLRRYAETGWNPAFTELVRRHVDLVYRAALRRTDGNTHRAADVAQQVFTALTRDAQKLTRHTVLAGWLHTATRNAALNLMISEQRHQARELAAQALAPAAEDSPLDWDRLRPVLDAAIDELPESDRTAVILRYLEQRPFAEIVAGAYLGFSREADLPPPPVVETSRTAALVDALRGENLALRTQIEQLDARLTALAQAPKPPPPPAPGKSRGEQQQFILNNLRQIAAARDHFILEERRPPLSAAEIIGYTHYVKRYFPVDGEDYHGLSMDPTQPMTLTTAGGITVTYDSRDTGKTTKPELTPEIMHAKVLQYRIDQADAKVSTMEKKVVPLARQAEKAYRAANGGRYAPNPDDLLPHFSTPQAGADWVEFIEATKAAAAARTAK